MTDAVKVGFVPFSAAPRGILVVFCDDALQFGPATRKTLGTAVGLVKRAAETNQFKGKSAAALDILAPEGLKAKRLIVMGVGKLAGDQGQRLSQTWRLGRRQAAGRHGCRDHRRRIARRRHEARSGGSGGGGIEAARLQIRPLQDQEEGGRGGNLARRCCDCGRRRGRGAKGVRAKRAYRRRRHHRARPRQRAAQRPVPRSNLPAAPANCAS